MDSTLSLIGSGLGMAVGLLVCGLTQWLRRNASKTVAFLGFGVTALTLLTSFFLASCASARPNARLGDIALFFLCIPVVCMGIASLHRWFGVLPWGDAFGALMGEVGFAFVTVLLMDSFQQNSMEGISRSVVQAQHIILSASYPVMALTMFIEEIAGPLRRDVSVD